MLIKTIQKIKTRKQLHHQNGERGAAMIFALLLLLIMIMLSITLTATATTSANSAREISLREGYLAAAQYGLENALFNTNNSSASNWLELRRTSPASGVLPSSSDLSNIKDLRFQVRTERVVSTGNRISYYVYSTGYVTSLGASEGITLRAIFEGTQANSGTYSPSGEIFYSLSPETSWIYGATGLNDVQLRGNGKIYTSNSLVSGNIPSGTNSVSASVYSNNSVTIQTANHGVKSIVTAGVDPSFGSGCLPAATCTSAGMITQNLNYEIGLDAVTDNVNSVCPNSSYPVWVASANSGILNLPNNSCVGGLVFDVNTTVPASHSKNSPLNINIKAGNIQVNNNIRVNQTNSPTALILKSSGGTVTAASGSQPNMFVSAPNGNCTINSNRYFGGLACNNLTVENGAIVYLDEAIKDTSDTTSRRVWSITYIEEV